MWFFLAFLAVPILEIALFIQVGGLIGLWPTLGLVILAGVAGTALIRAQGLRALPRLRARIEAGEDPSGPLVDSALIVVAGILLLIPG
ncbi:MAG: FxsA family protein, partial [Rhodobacteraceae bacterium]|nr:FxsA family protein [Paracoccaceae bacterium]